MGDDKMTIDSSISIKLSGFQTSELFQVNNKKNPFECMKRRFCDHMQYASPKVFAGERYDARAADIWACGMIVYEAMVGAALHLKQNDESSNYCIFERKALYKHLQEKNLNQKSISLLLGLLEMNTLRRLDAMQILKHPYFKSYYAQNRQEIKRKSYEQMEKKKTNKMD